MEEKPTFGIVKTPVNAQHQQTGQYRSLDWNTIIKNIIIKLYSPSLGDPLFEEVASKNYRYEPKPSTT